MDLRAGTHVPRAVLIEGDVCPRPGPSTRAERTVKFSLKWDKCPGHMSPKGGTYVPPAAVPGGGLCASQGAGWFVPVRQVRPRCSAPTGGGTHAAEQLNSAETLWVRARERSSPSGGSCRPRVDTISQTVAGVVGRSELSIAKLITGGAGQKPLVAVPLPIPHLHCSLLPPPAHHCQLDDPLCGYRPLSPRGYDHRKTGGKKPPFFAGSGRPDAPPSNPGPPAGGQTYEGLNRPGPRRVAERIHPGPRIPRSEGYATATRDRDRAETRPRCGRYATGHPSRPADTTVPAGSIGQKETPTS